MTNQLMSNKRLLDSWRKDMERRERNCLEKACFMFVITSSLKVIIIYVRV